MRKIKEKKSKSNVIIVSKGRQRKLFYQCNVDANENLFNMYWKFLVGTELPSSFPNSVITLIEDDFTKEINNDITNVELNGDEIDLDTIGSFGSGDFDLDNI
jgi:hypothetical protein